MAAFKDTFKRCEIKYPLTEKQYLALMSQIQEIFIPDEYGETLICNTYYDTPDSRLIRTSLDKPVYKEKLRLRSYGIPENESRVFVEIKKKYKGIVYKRRIALDYKDATEYLAGRKNVSNPSQISKEIDYFLDFYKNLAPAMMVSYRRTAYFGAFDPNLRLTFDKDIMWREDFPDLICGAHGKRLVSEQTYIMELKIPEVIPLELSRILDENKIFPASFSKYGEAYLEERRIAMKKTQHFIKGVTSA